jgi:basic membrane protein A and related proteins
LYPDPQGGFGMKRCCAIFIAVCALAVPACKARSAWQPGMPMPREQLKIGVLYFSNPDTETSGWSFSHARGIREMQKNIGLHDDSIMYKVNLDDADTRSAESAIRNFIANGANLIIATSWGYMDVCEKMAKEFPGVIFAHASGYKLNDTKFTNYFGRVYLSR